MPGLHPRAPSNYADLMLGIHYFLKFCRIYKYITKAQENEIKDYHSDKLIELLGLQPLIHKTADIRTLIKNQLNSYITAENFTLLKIENFKKIRLKRGYSDNFIGWLDYKNNCVYIQSERANMFISKMPDELKKLLGSGSKSVWSNLERHGLLAEKDVAGKKNVVRKTINGKEERVYVLGIL